MTNRHGPRQTASHIDAIKINAKLQEVLRKADGGYVEYIDRNITDETIAAEFEVSRSSVASIRSKMFGSLVGSKNNMLTHFSRVASELEQVKTLLSAVVHNHNTLCTQLSLNRVLDVRSLAVGAKPTTARNDHQSG